MHPCWHKLSTHAMFNINMEERIPLSPIVRRPYCSLLASALLHVLTVCLVLMRKSVSTLLCPCLHRVCVCMCLLQQSSSYSGSEGDEGCVRGPPWPIKATGLRTLGPAIRAQHCQLFYLEAQSVKWTLSLKRPCVRTYACTNQFRDSVNIWQQKCLSLNQSDVLFMMFVCGCVNVSVYLHISLCMWARVCRHLC